MSIGFVFEIAGKTAKIRVDGKTVEVPISELPKGAEEMHELEFDGGKVRSIVTPNPAQSMPNRTPMEMRTVHPDEHSATGAPSMPSEQNERPDAPQIRARSRQQYSMQKLTSLGWTPVQAAGVVGRFMQESYPDLRTNAVGDAGISMGVGQWNKERRAALTAYATGRIPAGYGNHPLVMKAAESYASGRSPASLDTQLEFFDWEIRNSPSERFAFRTLSQAETPEQASQAMMHFERPSGYSVRNPSGGHGYKNTVRNSVSVLTTYDPNMRIALNDTGSPPANGGEALALDQAIEPPSSRGADSSSRRRGLADRFVPPDLSAFNVDLGLDQAIAEGKRRIAETSALGLQPQQPIISTFGDFYRRYSS